jgi:hypothetical protein
LRLQCSDCEDLLHELSNVVTGVLMNAQILECRLPPYSHLKRSVREMERNAQRGSELLKRLMRPLAQVAAESKAAVPGETVRNPTRRRLRRAKRETDPVLAHRWV